MKKRYYILLSVLFITLLFTTTIYSESISSNQAVEDLKYLIQRLEEVHPNIYFDFKKEQAESKLEDIIEKLRQKEKWNRMELYRLFTTFVASFKDGHTMLSFNVGLDALNSSDIRVLPLEVRFIEDKVLIYKNYTVEEIEKGSELLAINGIDIDKILNKMVKSVSSENSNLAYARIEKPFSIYLWALYDFGDTYKIKLQDNNNKVSQVEVKGITKEIYDIQRKKEVQKNWTLDFPVKGCAYLTINTFNGSLKKDFEKDMDKYFEEIDKKDISNLFIDISENGGGNTDLAKYLFEFIYDKPYSLFKEVKMKYSDFAFKDRTNFLIKLYYKFKMNEDNIIVFDSSKITPKDKEYRFNGNVYVITSDFTFSTATDFAAVVKDHNAGQIVGEETGGLASCYGDMIVDQLPNSKLSYGVSYKYFLRPSGVANGRGVIPDIKLNISKLKYWNSEEKYRKKVIGESLDQGVEN